MKQTTHQPSFRNGHATKDQETFGTGCVGRRVGDTGLVHMSNLLGCTPHSTTDLARVFDHTGSSFDSFLEEEGILDEVDATATKRVVEWQLDIAAQADAMEGIRQGLEDARLGRLRPAREFFAEFEAKHGISHD